MKPGKAPQRQRLVRRRVVLQKGCYRTRVGTRDNHGAILAGFALDHVDEAIDAGDLAQHNA